MPSPDLIIFDCDGVLVDSEIIAARVDAALLTEAGYPVDAADVAERFSGLPFREILLEVERESGTPLSASLIERSSKELDRRLGREVRAVEGAARVLQAMQVPYCICSNSPASRIEITLRTSGLAPLLKGPVFSAYDLEGIATKPAPDVFLHAAQHFGANPANTFVLEDSVHGVHGAVAAGMRAIGFTGASHSWPGHGEKLIEAGAETVINRFALFPDIVDALAGMAEPI